MNKVIFEEKILTKIGYLITKLPDIPFKELVDNVLNNDFSVDYKKHLIGQIENEKAFPHQLFPNEIKNILIQGCNQYIQTYYPQKIFLEKYILNFDTTWINFQRKGEYQPVHKHTGNLVYVIWVKIPYDIANERNLPHAKNNKDEENLAANFEFVLTNTFNEIVNNYLPVDKTYEGTMVIFDARLFHCVYPFFTSDEYRISISGNILIEREKKEKPIKQISYD